MSITIKDYIEGRVNEQQVFDFVLAKLREQGGCSMIASREACSLRGSTPTGAPARCAVGWLLPDEEYHKSMEYQDIVLIVSDVMKTPEHILRSQVFDKIQFLQDLICLHDSMEGMSGDQYQLELTGGAQIFAADHGLNWEHV